MSNSITSQTPLPHPIPAVDDLGPLVGKNFGGYEIASYIGEGPTGAVYRGEDLVGTRMAVKVMHQELSRKDAADALWADLQKLTALGNKHLVNVYDAGFGDEGQFFYAMDELVGCDLEAGLEESGALTPRKAVEIIRQICVAVEAAHKVGVVHGGLKPRNVFLCPRDTELVVKVLDFGAARLAGGISGGVIVGNPFYMAPEQYGDQFGGTPDPRTDVYSLGVMMYELFSGTLPFSGPSHGQVMMRHLSETPPPPPGVEAELGRIILRALAKTPAGRFQTVKQLREALDRWAKSQPKLEDIVAHQVISRAREARQMKQEAKQAGLSLPDQTAQMPRFQEEEMMELARNGSRQDAAANNKNKPAAEKPENPNSSESVEASLEDFISQANASFPTSDGWDLHTGDVELIDDGTGTDVEDASSPKPLIVKPRRVEPAPVENKKQTSKGIPVVQAPEPVAARISASHKAVPPVEPPSLAAPAGGLESLPSSAPPRRTTGSMRALGESIERTDVVSSPLPRQAAIPWTANPLVIIGGLLAAFVIGAMVVFFIIKNIAPAQPPQITVTTPAPQVVYQQPAAPAPVVTPLQPQPVVVPLGQQAQPAAAQPAAVAAPAQPAAAAEPATPEPAKPAAPKKKAAAPAKKKVVAEEKPAAAAAPKKEAAKTPAKKASEEKKGGGDWVDPFAQ
jgi:serine/threonine protein kinase